METNKIPARADVPEKDKWAIQDLFATDDDWRAALAKAKEFIPRITAFRGRLAESGAALLSFFRLDDEISLAFDALSYTTHSAAAMRTPALPRIRRWSAR